LQELVEQLFFALPDKALQHTSRNMSKNKLKLILAPSPVVPIMVLQGNEDCGAWPRLPAVQHSEVFTEVAIVSSEWYALVHTPIPLKEAHQILKAREAVDVEWQRLAAKGTWDLRSVRPKHELIKEDRSVGKEVLFGSLRDLCYEKHSELSMELCKCKGRVLFRGNIIRKTGNFEFFSEQSSSAPYMAAANMDAIVRLQGKVDSDSVGAYHQANLDETLEEDSL